MKNERESTKQKSNKVRWSKEVFVGTLSLRFTNFYDDYMLLKCMMIERT